MITEDILRARAIVAAHKASRNTAPVVIVDQTAPLAIQHPGDGYFLLFKGERAIFSRIHLKGWSRRLPVVVKHG